MSKVLVDGDIIAYKSCYGTLDKPFEDTLDKMESTLEYIGESCLFEPNNDHMEVFLTGKGNFRYDLYPEYKANRKGSTKPENLSLSYGYLIEEWGAKVSSEQEADDDISIRATELGPSCIVASIDKDFLQLPCNHFNFVKGTHTKVSEFEGLYSFYKQILTGDSVDNIKGLWQVGDKKADKILEGCKTEEDLWDCVLRAYDGDLDSVLLNGRLLWLRREEKELWGGYSHKKEGSNG